MDLSPFFFKIALITIIALAALVALIKQWAATAGAPTYTVSPAPAQA